jgi:hypothetical protein
LPAQHRRSEYVAWGECIKIGASIYIGVQIDVYGRIEFSDGGLSENEKPGCSGVAAKLPKAPGSQTLMPPSSACADGAATITNAIASAKQLRQGT